MTTQLTFIKNNYTLFEKLLSNLGTYAYYLTKMKT